MLMHCSSLAPYITDSASSSIAASVERVTATKLQDKSEDMLAKTVLEEVLKFATAKRELHLSRGAKITTEIVDISPTKVT